MLGISNKDEFFFRSFESHAAHTQSAATLLVTMLAAPKAERPAIGAKVKDFEKLADELTHKVVRELHETWITPFDRDDIHALINKMDDVTDGVLAVTERVNLFDIDDVRPEAIELAMLVSKCCEKLKEGVALLKGLKNPKVLLELCREINRIEGEADRVFRSALSNIYKKGATELSSDGVSTPLHPVDILKWKDIFDYLEAATDSANDVGNILEGIVLEYA